MLKRIESPAARTAGHSGESTLSLDVSELTDGLSFFPWQLGMKRQAEASRFAFLTRPRFWR